jgi:site-specific DNA-methyltransferase (adenine-specific)
MGDPLCHLNEAPFPESLPEYLIRTYCPPNGIVCDPFCGSGTTGAAALKWGRRFVGVDIRQTMVDLSNRRLAALRRTLGEG